MVSPRLTLLNDPYEGKLKYPLRYFHRFHPESCHMQQADLLTEYLFQNNKDVKMEEN